MENFKVGQSFEVVKVISNEDYMGDEFKIGGFTIAHIYSPSLYEVLVNGDNLYVQKNFPFLNMFVGTEVKPIGKLTIKSLK